jgi:hypothetical protein
LSEVIELLVYTSENIGTHDDLKTSLVTSWKKGQRKYIIFRRTTWKKYYRKERTFSKTANQTYSLIRAFLHDL